MKQALTDNEKTWDLVYEDFLKATALPKWGMFSAGENLNLIPEIKDKIFLEIACGSGASIKYLLEHGASKIYGLDISKKQLTEAAKLNKQAVETGKVKLFHQPMEQKLDIEPVDVVFSVYGLGWTLDPNTTLANIYSYLKPGGLLIWSWDHSFFSDVEYQDGKFVVAHSYHTEKPITLPNWKGKGSDAHLTYRKTATWFKLLTGAGFTITGYYEPEPIDMNRGFAEPDRYYSIDKAKKVPATMIFVCQK